MTKLLVTCLDLNCPERTGGVCQHQKDFDQYKAKIEFEISAELANQQFEHRIRCNGCGKTVSTGVPKHTIMRAWVECPECIEKEEYDAHSPDNK